MQSGSVVGAGSTTVNAIPVWGDTGGTSLLNSSMSWDGAVLSTVSSGSSNGWLKQTTGNGDNYTIYQTDATSRFLTGYDSSDGSYAISAGGDFEDNWVMRCYASRNVWFGSAAASDHYVAVRGAQGGFIGWDHSQTATVLQSPAGAALQLMVDSDTFTQGTRVGIIDTKGSFDLGRSDRYSFRSSVLYDGVSSVYEQRYAGDAAPAGLSAVDGFAGGD